MLCQFSSNLGWCCGDVYLSESVPPSDATPSRAYRLDTWLTTQAHLRHFKDARSVLVWMDDYGDDSQMPSVQDWDGNKIIGDFYHNLAKEDGVYKDVYGVPDCVTGRLFQETGKMTLEVIKRHLTSVDKILQLCGTRMCPAAKLRFCSCFETSNTSLHENIICDLDLRCILQL